MAWSQLPTPTDRGHHHVSQQYEFPSLGVVGFLVVVRLLIFWVGGFSIVVVGTTTIDCLVYFSSLDIVC